jgi:hypothetical protein
VTGAALAPPVALESRMLGLPSRRWAVPRLALCLAIAMSASAPSRAACTENDGSTPGTFAFASDAVAADFLHGLQAAVVAGDRRAVARLVHFPLTLTVHDRRITVRRANFSRYYAALFTTKVRAALAAARFDDRTHHACVFWNGNGLMIGDGEIWFADTDRGIRIIAVNP